jgi:acetyl esterase/lipase
MASWQANVIVPLLIWKVKRSLRAARDVAATRAILDSARPNVSSRVVASEETVGGVSGEWSRPRGDGNGATLLYLHGGGYVACSATTHRPITNAFAKKGFAVFTPNYRLAPEHPFPAAPVDALTVYLALLARGIAPERLVVAGDSAGGGLALAMMVMLRDRGAPMPAAAMLFSPWTDLACTGRSLETNARRCAMFNKDVLRGGARLYLGGADPMTPLASPLFADLRGLPQMRIHVGEAEVLLDDSLRLVERARAAGVACGARAWPVVPHVWQLFSFLPEAAESLDLAADFLTSAVAAAPVS